jgi:hypothetical protein
MRVLLTAVVGVGALLVGAASQANASPVNLVADGDFNNTNSTFVDYGVGPLPGSAPWLVTGPNIFATVDLIGGYWQSPSGPNAAQGGTNGSVDLDGLTPGGVAQTIATTAGQQYLLTFSLSGNPDGINTTPGSGSDTKTVDVVVGVHGTDYSFVTNIGGQSHSSMNYVEESLLFTASGPTTLLSFNSFLTPGDFGAVIGGVSVTATPLPSTWLLLLSGFGGLGFVAYRGTRKGSGAIAAA